MSATGARAAKSATLQGNINHGGVPSRLMTERPVAREGGERPRRLALDFWGTEGQADLRPFCKELSLAKQGVGVVWSNGNGGHHRRPWRQFHLWGKTFSGFPVGPVPEEAATPGRRGAGRCSVSVHPLDQLRVGGERVGPHSVGGVEVVMAVGELGLVHELRRPYDPNGLREGPVWDA
jgi:hypothetical protein